MDKYINSLAISPDLKIEDVVHPCCKILWWLSMCCKNNLTYKDLETIIKGAAFIDGCYKLFGMQLNAVLHKEYPFYQPFLESFYQKTKSTNSISYVSEELKDIHGYKYIYMFEKIMEKMLRKCVVSKEMNSIKHPKKLGVIDDEKCRNKMLCVVERVFRVPEHLIEEAIARMLQNLPFNVIGFVFLEQQGSPSFDKCTIVAQKLCEVLHECDANNLLSSLCLTASQTQHGLKFFWKCLEYEFFYKSIAKFFITYLLNSEIEHGYIKCNHKIYKKYNSSHILCLFCIILSDSSPRRIDLYKEILVLKVSLLDFLNELLYIYT